MIRRDVAGAFGRRDYLALVVRTFRMPGDLSDYARDVLRAFDDAKANGQPRDLVRAGRRCRALAEYIDAWHDPATAAGTEDL